MSVVINDFEIIPDSSEDEMSEGSTPEKGPDAARLRPADVIDVIERRERRQQRLRAH